MDEIDYSLLPESLIKQTFPNNNVKDGETVLAMHKCKKYNRYGVGQDRIFILSNQAFYLCSQTRVHTMMVIKDLSYIVKSLKSDEFLLMF